MRIHDILREGIELHGPALVAYAVVVSEAYETLPMMEEGALPAWHALLDHIKRMMPKVRSAVGVQFTDEQPYDTAEQTAMDIAKNKRLSIWTGGSDHPVFTPSENHEYRTVHDFFAHYGPMAKIIKAGKTPTTHRFDLRGEYNSYLVHAKMLSPKALPAMFTELVGQTTYAIITGHFPAQKVAIMRGFDYYRLGRVDTQKQARMQEVLDQLTRGGVVRSTLGQLDLRHLTMKSK